MADPVPGTGFVIRRHLRADRCRSRAPAGRVFTRSVTERAPILTQGAPAGESGARHRFRHRRPPLTPGRLRCQFWCQAPKL